MRTITWKVTLTSPPPVLRYCKKCGQKTEYRSSGLFRLNAQKKALDIWLIYKCIHCDTTWNEEIYSRIRPQSLPPELLNRFQCNEETLAFQYASDAERLRRAGAELGEPEYEVTGEMFSLDEPVLLKICGEPAASVKISALLRSRLSLSNREYEALITSGRIKSLTGDNLKKCRLNREITLVYTPPTVSRSRDSGNTLTSGFTLRQQYQYPDSSHP